SSRRRHTRSKRDWSSDVCSSDLEVPAQHLLRLGEQVVTDGPFAETKEVLGGYFLADCNDLDQAIELAQRIPLVDKGSVEIRPLEIGRASCRESVGMRVSGDIL